mmetsp:Transcript_33333/g.105627  ORF Transcript_33333/g.105627 Transcript_33333/m.105627 type:complete len:840 (+) Transcript_33333:95-2614(+)
MILLWFLQRLCRPDPGSKVAPETHLPHVADGAPDDASVASHGAWWYLARRAFVGRGAATRLCVLCPVLPAAHALCIASSAAFAADMIILYLPWFSVLSWILTTAALAADLVLLAMLIWGLTVALAEWHDAQQRDGRCEDILSRSLLRRKNVFDALGFTAAAFWTLWAFIYLCGCQGVPCGEAYTGFTCVPSSSAGSSRRWVSCDLNGAEVLESPVELAADTMRPPHMHKPCWLWQPDLASFEPLERTAGPGACERWEYEGPALCLCEAPATTPRKEDLQCAEQHSVGWLVLGFLLDIALGHDVWLLTLLGALTEALGTAASWLRAAACTRGRAPAPQASVTPELRGWARTWLVLEALHLVLFTLVICPTDGQGTPVYDTSASWLCLQRAEDLAVNRPVWVVAVVLGLTVWLVKASYWAGAELLCSTAAGRHPQDRAYETFGGGVYWLAWTFALQVLPLAVLTLVLALPLLTGCSPAISTGRRAVLVLACMLALARVFGLLARLAITAGVTTEEAAMAALEVTHIMVFALTWVAGYATQGPIAGACPEKADAPVAMRGALVVVLTLAALAWLFRGALRVGLVLHSVGGADAGDAVPQRPKKATHGVLSYLLLVLVFQAGPLAATTAWLALPLLRQDCFSAASGWQRAHLINALFVGLLSVVTPVAVYAVPRLRRRRHAATARVKDLSVVWPRARSSRPPSATVQPRQVVVRPPSPIAEVPVPSGGELRAAARSEEPPSGPESARERQREMQEVLARHAAAEFAEALQCPKPPKLQPRGAPSRAPPTVVKPFGPLTWVPPPPRRSKDQLQAIIEHAESAMVNGENHQRIPAAWLPLQDARR